MRMLVLHEEWGQKEQLKASFDTSTSLETWSTGAFLLEAASVEAVEAVEAVTCVVPAAEFSSKSSLALETVCTQPCPAK